MESNKTISKYHRTIPIKEFDLNQTLYSLVKSENYNNLNGQAIGYLGNSKTYQQLFSEVDRLADAYVKAGVRNGDTVAICTVRSPLVQQNLLALSKIGATSKWIDLRIKDKDLIKNLNVSNCKTIVIFDELTPLIQKIITETDINRVLISSPKEYLAFPIKLLADIKSKREGSFIEKPEDKRFIRFTDFINSGSKKSDLNPSSFEKEKPTLIIQSSGSTGKPKSIVHTDYNFNSAVQKMGYVDLPFYRDKTLYVAVPPFIIYGLANSVYASLAFGMKAEMIPYVSETTVYNDLGKFDMSFAAPLHYRYIYSQIKELMLTIDELEKKEDKFSRKELKKALKELDRILTGLKRAEILVSGGDKITAEEILEMQQAFDTVIINGYGNNEVVGAAVVTPRFANKPGTIGIPMHGIEAEIFELETNKQLARGEMGESCLCTDNAFVEYYNNPDETANIKQLHEDGKHWIHTGDLCIIDEDGFIIPKGRTRRVIYKEAFKICPDTIENLPYVRNCVVVGVNNNDRTELIAFIELEKEYESLYDDLLPLIQEKCSDELPDYEIPTYYKQIDKIPYTPNNKQDFLTLEKLGNDFIKENKPKMLIKICNK